jgi:ParB family chromosome partitioning protein
MSNFAWRYWNVTKERRLGRGLAALLGEDVEPVSLSQAAALQAPLPRISPLTVHSPDEEEELDDEQPERAGFARPPAQPPTDPGRPLAPSSAAPLAQSLVASEAATAKDGDLLLLRVDEIDDNPFQPRRDFTESEIASLAESLKEHDMLQPVLVRRMGSRWQLISGERRLRAAIRAGWTHVPARVRQADDRLVAELAIVENLQRKDLNAIEKALSFKRYLEQHQCTQEDLGRRLKIDRSTIANLVRLLELPESVQRAIQDGAISMGHARALLPLGEEELQLEYTRRIQREGLSVREIERLVQERIALEDGDGLSPASRAKRRKPARSSHIASLEQQWRITLGTRVDIRQNSRGRGQLVIHFKNNEEYDRLSQLISETAQEKLQRYAG